LHGSLIANAYFCIFMVVRYCDLIGNLTMTRVVWILAIGVLAACGGGGEGGNSTSSGATALKSATQAISASSLDTINDNDLAAFGNAVGEKRIVVLTEPTHGVAQALDLNARLIRYLHEHKGFDVLLIESGMFDVANMNELKQTRAITFTQSAPGRTYFGFSRNVHGQKIFAYVDQTQKSAKPLSLAGIDVMMEGVASTGLFVSRLEAKLQARNAAVLLDPDWSTYKVVAQRLTANPEYTDAPAELPTFKRVQEVVKNEFCSPSASQEYSFNSDGFWCRALQSLSGTMGYVWSKPKQLDYNERDFVAGNNAIWLMDRSFAGRKTIVLTHALHGFGVGSELQSSTGKVLADRYPGQIHTNHITARKIFSPDEITVNGSLEYELDQIGQLVYMNYPSDEPARNALQNLSVREVNFVAQSPNRFGRAYQSLFYVRQSSFTNPDWTGYPTIY
jgi:erythromycin esterase